MLFADVISFVYRDEAFSTGGNVKRTLRKENDRTVVFPSEMELERSGVLLSDRIEERRDLRGRFIIDEFEFHRLL